MINSNKEVNITLSKALSQYHTALMSFAYVLRLFTRLVIAQL